MLSLLREQDLGAFSLEVFIIPADFFASKRDSYLFLEQYHLLNKRFYLNIQRTVQFRALGLIRFIYMTWKVNFCIIIAVLKVNLNKI